MNLAYRLAKVLRSIGVDRVFGVPGKSVVPLILAMNDTGCQFTLARQESGAGFMACGYSLSKNTLGVVVGTSGPGGTNMITAAAQAMAYNAPVLFITGHQSMVDTGKPMSQDSSFYSVDLVDIFKSVTKFSAMVERPELFERYLKHALDEAMTGSKGPVHLSLPFDVQVSEVPDFEYVSPPFSYGMVRSEIETALSVLQDAKKPAILAGKGVKLSRAYKEIIEFSELFNIPVVTTPGGKGSFPSTHPLSVGPYGLGGSPEVKQFLWSNIDVLVVLGSRLSDFSIPGFTSEMQPRHVIQLDINRKFIGYSLDIPTTFVSGDIKTNLREMINLTPPSQKTSRSAPSFEPTLYQSPENFGRPLYVSDVISEVNNFTTKDDNTLLYADMGSHGFAAVRYFDVKTQGSFMFDDYFACMGAAIGCAIGAKAGNPHLNVTCITGDGCFAMLGTEVSTSVSHDLPVIFIVVNNGQLDMVHKGMTRDIGRSDGTVFTTPLSASLMGRSLGAESFECHDLTSFISAYDFARKSNKTTVIEVITDPAEPTLTTLRKNHFPGGEV